MRTAVRTAVAAGTIVVFGAVALPASGTWSTPSGSGNGAAKAVAAVGVPTSVTASPTTAAPDSSITISWQAPTSGPTPTAYRVDRISPAATNICPSPTLSAGIYSCNDVGRTAGTTYEYKVYALVQLWNSTEVSRSATPVSATTSYYLKQDHTSTNATTGLDTTPSTILPMSTTVPPIRELANYDTDRDTQPGLLLARGTTQRWSASTGARSLAGTVKVRLWTAMKDFANGKTGVMTVALWNCNHQGQGCSNAALATQTRTSTESAGGWKNGRLDAGDGTRWVEHEWSFSLAAGTSLADDRTLEVRVTTGATSADDMWLAYDTSTYPSRVLLP